MSREPELAGLDRQLVAAHARHPNVGDQKINGSRAGLQDSERLDAIRGGQHGISLFLEDA